MKLRTPFVGQFRTPTRDISTGLSDYDDNVVDTIQLSTIGDLAVSANHF